ncbi:polymorphic toxin-type HINT domain-containing protein [Streptomyces sp. MST-110588]|uniref:polymorphic toxin-type HINT domain-containing protein n=1 Tax=Streptomyces sp. MST-110588 TaxID=2833628 RepID=UPI001F5C7FC0|nr:polymorphic toxin-type HINT domain-containing protein [Streptomyces sp. MST-110588]
MASLLGGAPAYGADSDMLQVINAAMNRGHAVRLWQSGGAGIKEAAEKALLGTDEDVANFLKGKDAIQRIDDRVAVGRMINVAGPSVREAALAALSSQNPDDVQSFLEDGWKKPLQVDRRVEAGKVINAGDTGVKEAGEKALKGTPEDVVRFLNVGQYKARETDNRVEAGKIVNTGGPNVKAAGTTALQGTPNDVAEFLEVGQFVARNRDQEHASIEELAEQAEKAGARAKEAAEASIEAKNRAVTASKLAKEAAQDAAKETQAAKNDAKTAALKAKQAANAAKAAAEATQRAIDSANAANRAARVAALAAARAANAAIGASNAASRAWKAAAAAANDATKAEDAKNAAAQAHTASIGAKKASQAAEKASQASVAAAQAAQASLSASSNAEDAADAADEADRYASDAGYHSSQAKAAAAETRRHAQESRRAANAAVAFANQSATAAREARDAANSAATHAENAGKAAEEAAKHAGEAKTAAKESAKHAAAAKDAADSATAAVTIAKTVFKLAREIEAQDLSIRTAAAMERAASQKTATDEFTTKTADVVVEGKAIEKDITDLAAQADKSDADTKTLAAQGRAVALRVLKHFGSWRQEAATQALSGTDDDVLEYLRTGWKRGEQDETRQQVTDLAARSPYEAVRTAATKALEGTPEQIRDFYITGQYKTANVEYRVLIGKIDNDGGPSVKEAAEKALADGSPQAMLTFLNSGQYKARHIDQRVVAGKLFNDGGPEMQAAAKVALAGSAGQLDDFIQVGQYMADRKDQLATVHINQVQRLIQEADVVAARAQQNRWLAAKAAADAKHAKDEAQKAATQASKFAADADGYATDARNSAESATTSAKKAGKSAVTAVNAANRADRAVANADESAAQSEFSANYAHDSAYSARNAASEAQISEMDAGKSLEEANTAAAQAWGEVVKKREAELTQARRQAEEQRKQERASRDKKPCVLNYYRDSVESCVWAMASGSDEYVLKVPEIDPTMKAIVWEVFGLNDVKECAKDPSFGHCSMAAISVLPIGKWKLAKKAYDGVEDIAKGYRYVKKLPTCKKCFLAGTKVLMADNSTKNIESVRAGELVVATDPLTGQTARRKVTAHIITEDDKSFNELTVTTRQGRERLTATHEHPFWSPSQKEWVKTADLKAGMTLKSVSKGTVTVQANHPFAEHARTYNLTVEGLHTYYVLAGATPVLVHNCDGIVHWVNENANMSSAARAYDAGATGSRAGLAPALQYYKAGASKLSDIKFDGFDATNGVMIDRKVSVTTFNKTYRQAMNQSLALEQNGYTGRWEVPTEAEAVRARRVLGSLLITNIRVRVVP